MKNSDDNIYISYWLKRYFLEYTVVRKNLSLNTRKSYRDCFKLLICYLSSMMKKKIDSLQISDMSAAYVADFLYHIELNRHCSIATRNQRLLCIQGFAQFIAENHIEYAEWCRQIGNIPLKIENVVVHEGVITPKLYYLELKEMQALLDAPDQSTGQGKRDYALLMFLYNSGTRASEAASLTIANLFLGDRYVEPYAVVKGKGNKSRKCPLWKSTIELLKPLIEGRKPSEPVFFSRYNRAITRFGIYEMVKRYAATASKSAPSILKKRVSPHTIRHSMASHLLEAGIDINTIRGWIGHVSVNTTNIYAEVNMQMKADAINTCEISKENVTKRWKHDADLMNLLKSI